MLLHCLEYFIFVLHIIFLLCLIETVNCPVAIQVALIPSPYYDALWL